jgi:hypothetical protein
MPRVHPFAWSLMFLAIMVCDARPQQVAPSAEATRAAQNALRNGVDRSVTVTIVEGGTVPLALRDATTPMALEDDERLVVTNASGGEVWLRFTDDRGVPLIADTIAIANGGSTTLAPRTLARLAGIDRLLAIAVTAPDVPPPTPPVAAATMHFVIEGGSPETQAKTDAAQVTTAQAALKRAETFKPPVPGRLDRLATLLTTLNVSGAEAPDTVKEESRPLPVERVIQDGQPIKEGLVFLSNTPKAVTFNNGCNQTYQLQADIGRPISYDEMRKCAGRDGNLAFTVKSAAGQWTGYLTLNVSALETGHIFVPIDLTGVSDWRFVNPRTPARIGPLRGNLTATLEFVNRVPGRTIKVTFPAIADTLQDKFKDAGFEVQCSRPTTCTPELVLQAANRRVDAALLVGAYGGAGKEGLVDFKISFFEGDIEPANSTGYLAVTARPYEPSFSAGWSAAANAGFLRDAHFAGFTMSETEAPIINTATPFDDHARWHLTGNVRLSVRPQLGTRANAEVDLVVKDKDFGQADLPTVFTQRARVNVFGYNGFAMSIGRFDFAAPTRSISISESGEGFSGRWRRFTVSHVVRPRDKLDKGVIPVPEGAKALVPASPDLKDRWSTLGQAQWAPSWLRFETSALIGHRKTLKGAEGLYYTLGGDVMAANGFGNDTKAKKSPDSPDEKLPGVAWRLNGGLYGSRRQRRASAVDATAGDRGWTGLVDGTLAWLSKRTPTLTVGATAAMGSRDETSTAYDESYAGESGAFTPDKIFLATLAGKVASLSHVDASGEQQTRSLSGGITGKKYLGVGFVYQGFSPLQWLVQGLGVPESDVNTRSVTVRWHGYSLRNPVATTAGESPRSWLGQETSMEWLLESPRGVRYTLTGAYFAPSALLKAQRLIVSSTWYVDARVTVTLK